jgi:hypothetical protein
VGFAGWVEIGVGVGEVITEGADAEQPLFPEFGLKIYYGFF